MTRYRMPISKCIIDFLQERGSAGATAGEICQKVWEILGEDVPNSSIYSMIFSRIPGAKGNYTPLYERFEAKGQNRYRLLKTDYVKQRVNQKYVEKTKHSRK